MASIAVPFQSGLSGKRQNQGCELQNALIGQVVAKYVSGGRD
jgi:hypothetical protein